MAKAIRHRTFAPLTPLRAERLRHALTIADVAREARLTSFRLSIIERNLDDATPEELAALRDAIARLTASGAVR
jgi:hypothetical protein